MYVYEQVTGRLSRHDVLVGVGYSGFEDGKNNPDLEAIRGVGPIPVGAWWIGDAYDSQDHGPLVMPLVPVSPGTQTFGRSGFLIHGDSILHVGFSSHGCLVFSHDIRDEISSGHERLLIVVSGRDVKPRTNGDKLAADNAGH